MNSSRASSAVTAAATWLLVSSVVRAQEPRGPFDGARSIDLATSPAVVPLTKDGDFYFVNVQLNGKPFRFTLETGAGFVAISTAAARSLGMTLDSVPPLAPGQPGIVAFIDSLGVGPITYRGVSARVTSMWNGAGFDGVISIPLLRDLLVTLDLGNRRLVVERGSLPAANGREVVSIPGTDRGGRADLAVDLGGTVVPAVLDTRSFIPLVVPDSLESSLRLEAPPRPAGMARGPSLGSFTLRGARLAGSARLGAVIIERAALTFRNRPGAVIGVPLLEQMVITLDLRNRRARVVAASGKPITMPAQSWEGGAAGGQRSLGFNLAGYPGSGQLRILNVVPGSDAEKQGIRNDDQVVELDGVPVERMNPGVVRSAVARGTPIKVVVRRGEKELTFFVTPSAGGR